MNDVKKIIMKMNWRASVKNLKYHEVYEFRGFLIDKLYRKSYNYRLFPLPPIFDKYMKRVGVLPKNY